MNIQDFRIGNIVYCKTKNGNKVGKICALTDTMISADVLDEKDDNHYRNYVGIYRNYVGKISDGEVDCVLPIPLTDAIIDKIGLGKDNENGIEFRYYLGTDYPAYIKLNNGFEYCFPTPKYVHELQNLYYDTNKKEIDFKL